MKNSALIDIGMHDVIWARTNREPVMSRQPLPGDVFADLVVIGAGFLGLSTAINAAKAGLNVIVIEAGTVGVGASGRNGGYTVPHFPGGTRLSAIDAALGKKKARDLCELVADGPNRIAKIVSQYKIESSYRQNGWSQPAHSEAALRKVEAVFSDWKAFGAPVTWLNKEAIQAETGSPSFLAGWKSPTGAVVNPYAQCLGLARAAEAEGATVYEGTRASSIEQAGIGRVQVHCETGGSRHVITARKVLIATNAYTDDLVPSLSRSVLTVRLYNCATRPLPVDLLKTIIPNRNCFTDLSKSGGFGRLDDDGRLFLGGAVFGMSSKRSYGIRHARWKMRSMLPQLKSLPLEFDAYWEGNCALSDNSLPHIQRLTPDVFSVLGFSTRGVNLAQNIGFQMGDFFGGCIELGAVPLEVVDGVRKIAFNRIKTAVGRQVFPVFQARDWLGLS